MADLTRTLARVRPLEGIEARNIPMIADEAIQAGQPVYRKANGRAGLASAAAAGTAKVVGVATTSVQAGRAFEAGHYIRMVGFDLAAIAFGTTVYLSNTAGALADAAGTVSRPLGSVHGMTDVAGTKFIFFDIPQNQI
jgi:hypothetical protein